MEGLHASFYYAGETLAIPNAVETSALAEKNSPCNAWTAETISFSSTTKVKLM
jgi:hypothetical protein